MAIKQSIFYKSGSNYTQTTQNKIPIEEIVTVKLRIHDKFYSSIVTMDDVIAEREKVKSSRDCLYHRNMKRPILLVLIIRCFGFLG